MNSTEDFDMFDFEDDILLDDEPVGYTFDVFKAEYPQYLDSLNNYIKLIYNTYVLIHNKRFLKIKKSPDCMEIANKCGFGMLMRHAMETIVTSIATENGVEVGGRSVFERLGVLKGQSIPGYDGAKITILYKLLDITNEIAHPHVLHTKVTTFEQLQNFYNGSFGDVLDFHILYIENMMKNSRTHDFGITKDVLKSRKQSYKYLLSLKNQLENFNVFNKATNILIQGCLVRQLTECTANLWCYNYGIVPTDVSTAENQISLSKVLSSLSFASRSSKSSAFGTSALTPQVVSNLYDLKSASNSLMHVEKFASGNLAKQGEELSKLYQVIKSECSPHVMKKKLSEAASLSRTPTKKIREKSPSLTALLCGTVGWFGVHHFYAGNIVKGVTYILFGGFIIAPTLDLYKILKGRFRNGRGFRMKQTTLSSVLALLLLVAHLFLWYKVGTKVYNDHIKDLIKDLRPLQTVTLEKCDNSQIDNLGKITVPNYIASSYLKTQSGSYDASLCLDQNPSTCWQEGVAGNGEGESLTFTFSEKESIVAISILNGKHMNEKSFYDNSRASKITVKVGDSEYSVELDDTMEKQCFRFSRPIEAEDVTIIIDSAYPGNVWQDLCISEIEFIKEN